VIDETPETPEPQDVVAETADDSAPAAEEKPKPKRAPRKKAEPEAAAADAPADDAEAEEKPKPKRAPRKKAEPKAAVPEAEEAEAADSEDEAPQEKAPKAKTPKAGAAKTPAKPASAPRRTRGAEAEELVIVRAHARYIRSSARKARLVCDLLRGKSVEDARAILSVTNRAVARDWSKLLESAVANAENNHELDPDELRIHSIQADEGPTLKRFRPRAMGRATSIRKRTSHLTIKLTPKR
jgi:ribosomal protein L22